MINYTIMEYDIYTRKYTVVGIEEGPNSTAAKKAYVEKHGWESREGIHLFAKPPICR